jgi:hypothetical protein
VPTRAKDALGDIAGTWNKVAPGACRALAHLLHSAYAVNAGPFFSGRLAGVLVQPR